MKKYLPLICGISGEKLTTEEIKFFRDYKPWGIILFERNCVNKENLKNLTKELKEINHQNIPILIDQEGGRVSRLNFKGVNKFKSNLFFGQIIEKDADLGFELLRLNTEILAHTLKELGINTNTAPVLDLPAANESGVIGDRAFSINERTVSKAGKIVIETNNKCGIASVIKHLPGHGRARVDSHFEMPEVDEIEDELLSTDFKPFQNNSDALLGMTAHILFKSLDDQNIVTFSKKIIETIIRNKIGFRGLLMTDDISMKAISDDVDIAALKSLNAGCDLVLHCNGNINEINKIAERIKSEAEPILIPDDLINIYQTKSDFPHEENLKAYEYLTKQL